MANIKIASINEYIDKIIPLLSDLHRKARPNWTITEAIDHCESGRWLLVVDDSEVFSFIMVALDDTYRDGETHLRVVVCCHPNGDLGIPSLYPLLDMMAIDMGCQGLVMESRRKGWEKIGWTPEWITYSRTPVSEVQDV